MNTVRRLAGDGALLLATLGLFLCIGGIVAAWVGKSRVDTVGATVFGAADEAFGFVDIKLDRVKQVLERSRHRVSDMSRIAEQLKNAEANARKEYEPLLQTLEEVYQELKSAESWVDSSHAVASGISRVSAAVMSSDFAASRQESTGVAVALELQQFADAVAEALARLHPFCRRPDAAVASGAAPRTKTGVKNATRQLAYTWLNAVAGSHPQRYVGTCQRCL
jgi:hypothetical protein